MLFSELKCKDVINIRDCKKLGHVCDLEFDECSGCICKIMVPGGNQWLGFLRCEPNIVIPYKDIRQIGPDRGRRSTGRAGSGPAGQCWHLRGGCL